MKFITALVLGLSMTMASSLLGAMLAEPSLRELLAAAEDVQGAMNAERDEVNELNAQYESYVQGWYEDFNHLNATIVRLRNFLMNVEFALTPERVRKQRLSYFLGELLDFVEEENLSFLPAHGPGGGARVIRPRPKRVSLAWYVWGSLMVMPMLAATN